MAKLNPKLNRQGFLLLIKSSMSQAFNLNNDPTLGYAFDAATQDRAAELYNEIARLLNNATVHPRLESDADFQRFMRQAAAR